MRRRLEIDGDWRSEALPIHLRAYASPVGEADAKAGDKPRRRPPARPGPNNIVLVFDTETTVDPAQRVRVLFYQLRRSGRLDEEAAAYDPEAVLAEELATLRDYCRERDLPEPMTLDAFRRDVFLTRAYDCGAEIVGFNLPFDLARIALDAAPARVTKWRRKMRGGFTFKLSEDSSRPKVQVKHLSGRAAVIEFASDRRQRTSRSGRKHGRYTPVHRGHFTDVRTLAAALTSRSHSLKSLTEALRTPTQKIASDDHGAKLSFEYLDYARSDVQATWECFDALVAKFRSYGIGAAHWEILSEASIGKATLSTMGIRSWLSQNPDPDPYLLSKILCSYFGGRTEVRVRKTIRQVFHTDFTSMYPTVCTLMRLWRFVIATGFETRDATDEARSLLATVTAANLQDPAFWLRLPILVKIPPDDDLLPVRAPYCKERNATIGLNHLTSDQPIWMTLADCIAAKLLSGKAPEVLEALGFSPGPVQPGLKPLRLFGSHRVDPRSDDLFRRVIQLRLEEKARAKDLTGSERVAADDTCLALKILANSTSYGIFVQVNVDTEPSPVEIEVFAPDGGSFIAKSRKVERPGPFFHPLLATLITGAARLMLALAEHQAGVEGLDWVFCDTDSLALARPEDMTEPEFLAASNRVLEWFRPLDPYGTGKSILKAEDANFSAKDGKTPLPLYCLAVSSKRYALFNCDRDGSPRIRKASAHGLGHLLAPYDESDPDPEGDAGRDDEDDELPLWQRVLWRRMIIAVQRGQIDSMRYNYHPALRRPALSRYAATSPELWRWFARLNAGQPYSQQVKPFGFLYAPHSRGRRDLHPVAPFDRSREEAVKNAFDRITGERIPASALQTYAEALASYHLSPEMKFRNGEAFHIGRTERRHVHAIAIEVIGKEADRYEEAYLLGLGEDPVIRYDCTPALPGEVSKDLAEAAKAYGNSAVARATGLSRTGVAKARLGRPVSTRRTLAQVRAGIDALEVAASNAAEINEAACEHLRSAVREHGGVRRAGRAIGIDASNLCRKIRK
jgi:hypothetical protein